MITKSQLNNLEKVIQTYIPKNTRCRFDEQKNELRRQAEKQHIVQQIEKVENTLEVYIVHDWVPIDADMSVCAVCKEVAYHKPKRLSIKLNGEEINTRRPVVMCGNCLNDK